MAIFAATIIGRRQHRPLGRFGRGNGLSRALTGALAALPAFALINPASAQTVGNRQGVASGGTVLAEFFGFGGLIQPNNTATPPTLVDLQNGLYGYIKNPYIGVVVGVGGSSYGVNYPAGTATVTATHNSAGMLTFGNIAGSARFATDNFQALNGFQFNGSPYEIYDNAGKPFGYGVWPLPGWWEITSGGFIQYEYSAYTRLQLDATVTNVMGATGLLTEPQLINSVLNTSYDVGSNVQVTQQIRLYRTTAQMRWVITNTDTAPHTVRLRFTVNNRAGAETFGGTSLERSGYYFLDGNGLLSDNARVLSGAGIPDQFTVYGKRYETDSTTDPPFAARHIFRGFGATTPEKVVLAHPFELRPNTGGFDLNNFTRPKLTDGVATGVYFGPYVLGPGASQEVITYYGNGSPTDIPNNDYVVSADGPEALAYNTDAVNDPAIAGNAAADPSVAIPKFLSPSPFTIYGSIYNWTPRDPLNAVGLTNVRASLTLPTGLVLNSGETAEKLVNGNGQVPADTGADIAWSVRPTGEAFGTLAYQINMTTNEFQSRQITRSINIPATPFRKVSASAFQMIGFPFEFDPLTSNNGDPLTVVNTLTTPSDDAVFFEYTGNQTGKPNYTPATRLQTGIGYFHRPSVDRTIYAKGVRPLAGQADPGLTDFSNARQVQLNLPGGWNIISSPYVYDIPLRSLRFVTTNNNNVISQNFTDAVRSGIVRGGVFFISPFTNSYDFFTDTNLPLKPWEAYWIYTTQPLTMIYSLPSQRQSAVLPAPGSDPNPPTRGVIASGKALVAQPTAENWRLQLVASQGTDHHDRATIIGVNSDKTVTEGERSVPKPPTGVSDYVYVGIVKADAKNTRFAKDIRSDARNNSWEIEVSADKDGPVTLTWPNVGTLPRRLSLSLKDKETGRGYAMRSSSSVTVNVSRSKPTRLVITAKQAASQPLQINNLQIVGTRGTGGGRSFAFNLSREATITGRVKTITGKTVATLAVSRAATTGTNRLQWTGRAQNGSLIPPGTYMIEIVAQDDNGESASTNRPFVTLE